jgi:hypothetical protein
MGTTALAIVQQRARAVLGFVVRSASNPHVRASGIRELLVRKPCAPTLDLRFPQTVMTWRTSASDWQQGMSGMACRCESDPGQ